MADPLTVFAIGSGVLGAAGSIYSGISQANAYGAEASAAAAGIGNQITATRLETKQIQLQATAAEGDRMAALDTALAGYATHAAATGQVGGAGTSLGVMAKEDTRLLERDLGRLRHDTAFAKAAAALGISQLEAQRKSTLSGAKDAQTAAYLGGFINAGSSLLGTGYDYYKTKYPIT
jgi:hypothetical protein